jgi:VanZ family protein
MTPKYQDDHSNQFLTKLEISYFISLIILLLWPFDFFNENPTHWLSKENGIAFNGSGMVATLSPIPEFCEKLKTGKGLTIEVWLSTANTTQSGPARIISYSLNTVLRNFTLGQQGKDLVIRLRTSKTDLNGMNPDLTVENVFNSSEPIQLVISYDFVYQTVFVNGLKRIQSETPGGNFSNWDPNCYLAFGNEITWDRPWQGKLFQVNIYNRPQSDFEVIEKYKKGWKSAGGLIAGFLFDEGQGKSIRNNVLVESFKNLYMPRYLYNIASPVHYLEWPENSIFHRSLLLDAVLNFFGFIPLGLFLHNRLRNRYGLTWQMSVLVLMLGSALSLSVESLQYFSMERNSSSLDILTNTLGTAAGIMINRFYDF